MDKEIFMDMSRLVSCLAVIVVCLTLWLAVSKLYFIRLKKVLVSKKTGDKNQNSNVQHLLFSVVRGGIIFIAIMSIMSIYGINVTATVTGLGLASLVVGLALQDTIKDVFRGMSLMSDKFYDVGDVIRIDGHEFEVMAFTLRTTKMRDIDTGNIFTMFNGNVDSATKLSGVQFLDIPISYEEAPEYVNKVMNDIVHNIDKIDGIILCSYKGLQAFEESSCLYRIKITTRQAERPEMRRAALRVIQEGLAKANIHIPYNQLDVHFDK